MQAAPRWARAPARTGALVATLILAAAATAGANDVLVVFNAAFPIDAPGRADVRQVFLEDVTLDGARIVPAVYEDTDPDQTHFVESVLGMSPMEYDMHWSRRILRDGSVPPRRFFTVDALLRFVAGTPNAVGYVRHRHRAKVAAYGDALRTLPWTPLPTDAARKGAPDGRGP